MASGREIVAVEQWIACPYKAQGGEPVGHGFRAHEDVRLDAVQLKSPARPGPMQSGKNLVNNDVGAQIAKMRNDVLHQARVGQRHPADIKERFEDERGDAASY